MAVDTSELSLIKKVSGIVGLKWGFVDKKSFLCDDRILHIWVEGQEDNSGNPVSIWSVEAKEYDCRSYSKALETLKVFLLGFSAGKGGVQEPTKLEKRLTEIQSIYGFSDVNMESIISVCELMPSDPDGSWSILNENCIDIDFDDVASICHLLDKSA